MKKTKSPMTTSGKVMFMQSRRAGKSTMFALGNGSVEWAEPPSWARRVKELSLIDNAKLGKLLYGT